LEELMAETSEIKSDRSFMSKWILACTIGYTIGMPMGSLAGGRIGYSLWGTIVSVLGIAPEARQYDYVFASAVMGATLGGIIGLCQWFVLRKSIQDAVWWIWIGLLGNSFGMALNSVWPQKANFGLEYFLPTFFTALLTGYFESRLLSKSLPSISWIGTRVTLR
jgi:hypothetical protein